MRKRLVAVLMFLLLTCMSAPGIAFADEGADSVIAVRIEIGPDGAPVGAAGEGWTYENGVLVLEAEHAFTFTGSTFDVSGENRIRNNGIIEDGIFFDKSNGYYFAVRNEASGVIRGGTFKASIGNSGIIAGGTFYDDPGDEHGPYVSTSGGTITGGTFDCMVMGVGSGAIEGGTFNGYVNLMAGFTIEGGTFNEEVYSGNRYSNLGGSISGGVFNNSVSNWGTIEDGAFHEYVHNASNSAGAGTIAGGTFDGYVDNYAGAVISGGIYSDGGSNNSVQNDGTINGGEFAIDVNNSKTIGGNAVFHAYVENRSGGIIESGTFDGEVFNTGVIADGAFTGGTITVTEGGTIAGGTFSSWSRVESNDDGTISGGTFAGTVVNGDPDWNGAVITGGTFTGIVENHDAIAEGIDGDGNPTIPRFDAVVANESDGVIAGGTFDGSVIQNSGIIAGGAFGASGSVQSSGTITGGTFGCMVGNEAAGTIENGETGGPTFDGSVRNYGVVADGTFMGETSNLSGGRISGGTFAGKVRSLAGSVIAGGAFLCEVSNAGLISNATDESGKATIPHFCALVTNEPKGVVSGGRFELAVVDQGGTFDAGAYPVKPSLTGLTIRELAQTEIPTAYDAIPTDAIAELYATFEKNSGEDNAFALIADAGYALPSEIELRLGSTSGTVLAAGSDYTYDATTGTLAIRERAVTGPLYLVARGVPVPIPDPEPMPDDPAPTPTPEPEPAPAPNAEPMPLPTALPSDSEAKTLAATGDDALAPLALGVLLASGCVVVTVAVAITARRRIAHANHS